MDNLEISLSPTLYKAHGNASEAILDRFVKPRTLKMFGHPVYSLDGSGPSIAISGPHEDF